MDQYSEGYNKGYSHGFERGYSEGSARPPQYNGGAGNNIFDSGPYGKSRGVAGLLAILLGYLGVQYFYLGKVGAGLIAIALSLVTCGIFPLLFLVQGILMMTMSQEQFDQKYVLSDSTFPLF